MLALLLLALNRVEGLQDLPGTRALPRDAQWLKRHEAYVEEAKKGGIDLLLLGDSITEAWRGQRELWAERFAPLRAANFGLAGDGTQHLLWRLRNGEFDGLRPRTVMLMIGSNNLGVYKQDVESTVAGVKALVEELRQRTPSTKILLLGILPRLDLDLKEKIREANAALAKLQGATFLDFGSRLEPAMLPDGMHLSAAGFRIWADAVKDELAK